MEDAQQTPSKRNLKNYTMAKYKQFVAKHDKITAKRYAYSIRMRVYFFRNYVQKRVEKKRREWRDIFKALKEKIM